MIVVAGFDLCRFRLHSFQTGWRADKIDEEALELLDGLPSAKHYNFYDPKGRAILVNSFTFKALKYGNMNSFTFRRRNIETWILSHSDAEIHALWWIFTDLFLGWNIRNANACSMMNIITRVFLAQNFNVRVLILMTRLIQLIFSITDWKFEGAAISYWFARLHFWYSNPPTRGL